MMYVKAFVVGGILCAIGQILIDRTRLTPARILTGYVVSGIILTGIGVYDKVVEWAGCGATIPLLGFGYSMAKGVQEAIGKSGAMGILTGALTATAGGIALAISLSFICSLIFKADDKG